MDKNPLEITPETLAQLRANTQITVALRFMSGGRNEEALTAFERALDEKPDEPRALMGRALALGRLARYDAALNAAADLISRAPESGRAYNTRGVVYQMMGKWEEARRSFDKAIGLEPNDAGHYYNFACYWAARGDAAQCEEYLAQSLRLYPQGNTFAATDVDLAPFRSEPWFQDLIAFRIKTP